MLQHKVARFAVTLVCASSIGGATAGARPAVSIGVGAGTWSSTNVTATSGCTKVRTGGACTVTADSTSTTGTFGCVATSTVTGIDTRCRAVFTATLTLTGEEAAPNGTLGGDVDYDIELGVCAGLTLSGAQVQIHDPELGDFVVDPKVLVTTTAWKIDGSLIGVNVGSGSVTILHVVGTIKPGCVRASVRRGDTGITFRGVFSGSYQFL